MNIYSYFSKAMKCYESDLRQNERLIWRAEFIDAVPEECFSCEEWNRFLSYLMERPVQCESVAEAKEMLIACKCTKRKNR